MATAGSSDEAWFDTFAKFESDCEEDYQSIPDGIDLFLKMLLLMEKFLILHLFVNRSAIVNLVTFCRHTVN